MYARLTIGQVPLDRLDEGIRAYQTHTAPLDEPGFKGSTLLVDRQTGRTIVIALWETEADVQASMSRHQAALDQGSAAGLWGTPPTTEIYEVAGQFQPQ